MPHLIHGRGPHFLSSRDIEHVLLVQEKSLYRPFSRPLQVDTLNMTIRLFMLVIGQGLAKGQGQRLVTSFSIKIRPNGGEKVKYSTKHRVSRARFFGKFEQNKAKNGRNWRK